MARTQYNGYRTRYDEGDERNKDLDRRSAELAEQQQRRTRDEWRRREEEQKRLEQQQEQERQERWRQEAQRKQKLAEQKKVEKKRAERKSAFTRPITEQKNALKDYLANEEAYQKSLSAHRPQLEAELNSLTEQEMEWYRQEALAGNTFGNEGYDRYVTAIDPEGTTEHGQAKKRIDQLKSLIAQDEKPLNTDAVEDQARMYRDVERILQMPEDQKQKFLQYAEAMGSRDVRDMRVIKDLRDDGYVTKEWEKLAESWGRYRNAIHAQNVESSVNSIFEETGATGNWLKGAANAATIPSNLLGAIVGTVDVAGEAIRRLFSDSQYKTMDPNLRGYDLSKWSSHVRQETSEDILESVPGVGGKALNLGYNAIMQTADNLARIAVTGGAGSLVLAGMGSFQSAVQEASQRGASPAQAVGMGLVSGGLEVLTEKVSLDSLMTVKNPDTIKDLFINAAKQGGVEVSEEEASLVGNLIAGAIILGDTDESQQSLQQYLRSGMTLEEANNAVFQDNVKKALETATSSFLSGSLMSGVQGALTYRDGKALVQQEQEPMAGRTGQPEVAPPAQTEQAEPQQELQPVQENPLDKAIRQTIQPKRVDGAEFGDYNDLVTGGVANIGKEGKTFTDSNTPISFRWAVVPAESLITSHDEAGKTNDAYPGDLQPRDRTRITSREQISSMAKTLNPELLAESPTAQNGAPIVRGDGVVIGGNARVQAISSAYAAGNGNQYESYIRERAESFGIDTSSIPEHPVLVRLPTGNGNWVKMAEDLNHATTSAYSAAETASTDAQNVGNILNLLVPNESGDLNSKDNQQFVNAFIHATPEAERGRMVTSNGKLSQEGLQRAKSAVFAYAYQDQGLLERLTESLDNDAKNVTNALLAVAPRAAAERTAGSTSLGVGDAIISGVNTYLEAKSAGISVSQLANQTTIDRDSMKTSSEVFIASFLENNKRSSASIKSLLSSLYDELSTYDPDEQTSMFNEQPSLQEIMKGAARRYESETGKNAGEFDGFYDKAREQETPYGNSGGSEKESRRSGSGNSGQGNESLYGRRISGQRADESTGAAPIGFDPYASLQYETGNKPDRNGDVRPVNVPNRDLSGKRVSDFAANAYGAKVTPDRFISVIEKMVVDGDLGVDVKSNRRTFEEAAKSVEGLTDEQIRANLSTKAESGKAKDTDIALAQLMFAKYVNEKGRESQKVAAELFANLAAMATDAGRKLQLYRAFRKLTPEGRYLAVQQEISKLAKRHGVDAEITIPDELVSKYVKLEADGAPQSQIEEALDKIYKNAAAQMPGTLKEKWDAWRYLSMLGNVKTHGRNTIGNAVFGEFADVKRSIGAALELLLPQEERTKSVLGLGKNSRALLEWAKQDAKTAEVSSLLSPSGKTGDNTASKIEQYRQIFKNKTLEKVVRFNGKALEAEDLFFKRRLYASSLASYLKAKGYTAEQISNGDVSAEILDSARAYSAQEALKGTFNDINAFSKWFSEIGRKKSGNTAIDAIKEVVGEGVLPFRKTPANIVVRGVEYSPVGIVRALYQSLTKVRTGEMSAAECFDTLSAGLTGTGVYALGALLSSLGIITGGAISDDDDREGRQTYALEIFGKSITLDWLAPAAIPFFMGVETQKAMAGEYGDVSAITAFLRGMGNAAEPLLELSCLSSLNDLIKSARYADDGSMLSSLGVSAATSYFMQALPTLAGQFDQAADKNRKTIYTTSSDPAIKEIQRLAGRMFQKLPGDFFQAEYVDEWGRTESKGSLPERIFNAFLNPAYVSDINITDADKEIGRLSEATGENVSPNQAERSLTIGTEKVNLTADQWETLAKTQGSAAYSMISSLISQSGYGELTDHGKTKAIKEALQYARELGRMEATQGQYAEPKESWMKELSGDTGDKAIQSILHRAAQSDVGESSEGTYDKAVEAGFSHDEMKRVFESVSAATKQIEEPTKYDKYRAVISTTDGENAEKWLSIYGMTDAQIEDMLEAEKKGCKKEQFVSVLEATSEIGKAFDSATSSWKNGEEPDKAVMDAAYSSLKGLKGYPLNLAEERLSARERAFVRAKDAGCSTAQFLVAYKKYRDIQDNDNLSASKQALEWQYYLDRTTMPIRVKTALSEELGFSAIIRQDSGQYGKLTESGLDAVISKTIVDSFAKLTPEPGKESVTNRQKFDAIGDIDASSKTKDAALRAIMPENMVKNYQKAADIGLSPDDWIALYGAYRDINEAGGKGQKNKLTQWCMAEFGMSYSTARAVADIYL